MHCNDLEETGVMVEADVVLGVMVEEDGGVIFIGGREYGVERCLQETRVPIGVPSTLLQLLSLSVNDT